MGVVRETSGWLRVAREQSRGAVLLREHGLSRPCVSRAYYAVYSLITSALQSQAKQSRTWGRGGRKNPDHADLPALVRRTLRGLDESKRRQLQTIIIRMRNRREDADYRPGISVDNHVVSESLRDMHDAAELLGARW